MFLFGLVVIAVPIVPLIAAGILGQWAMPLIKLSALVGAALTAFVFVLTLLFAGLPGLYLGAFLLGAHVLAALISRVRLDWLRWGLALVTVLIFATPGAITTITSLRGAQHQRHDVQIRPDPHSSPPLSTRLRPVRSPHPFSAALEPAPFQTAAPDQP